LSEVDINEVKQIVDNIIKEEEELFRRNMNKLELKEKHDNENEDTNIVSQKNDNFDKNCISENLDKVNYPEVND